MISLQRMWKMYTEGKKMMKKKQWKGMERDEFLMVNKKIINWKKNEEEREDLETTKQNSYIFENGA